MNCTENSLKSNWYKAKLLFLYFDYKSYEWNSHNKHYLAWEYLTSFNKEEYDALKYGEEILSFSFHINCVNDVSGKIEKSIIVLFSANSSKCLSKAFVDKVGEKLFIHAHYFNVEQFIHSRNFHLLRLKDEIKHNKDIDKAISLAKHAYDELLNH